MQRRKIGEKKHVFMLVFSFFPCDNDSELNPSMNKDTPEVLKGSLFHTMRIYSRLQSKKKPQFYITSPGREICTFAVLCSVIQPFLSLHSCQRRCCLLAFYVVTPGPAVIIRTVCKEYLVLQQFF